MRSLNHMQYITGLTCGERNNISQVLVFMKIYHRLSLTICFWVVAFLLCMLPRVGEAASTEPTQFAVIIPSYNNEKWCIENLESVVNQTYPHYHVWYINDCSSDETLKLVCEFIETRHLERKITIINNRVRKYALHNIYDVVQTLKPTDVILHLDGDDKLASSDVFEKVASYYADPEVWVTYGNYETTSMNWGSCCEEIPLFVMKTNSFRRYKWVTHHLKSSYAKLFQLIKKEDLMWEGKFFPMTWDFAFMFPILEMASHNHIRFIPQVLYHYNVMNPINDFRTNSSLQNELGFIIRNRPPYNALDKLF